MFEKSEDHGFVLHVKPDLDFLSALYRNVANVLEPENNVQSGSSKVVRIQVPTNDIDPFQWLHSQKNEKKIFWKGREDDELIAGLGVVDEIRIASSSLKQLRNLKDRFLHAGDARYFGGGRFDTSRESSVEWSPFGSYYFVLPRFELIKRKKSTSLICNLILPEDTGRKQEILEEISQLNLPSHDFSGNIPLPVSRIDFPSEATWHRIVVDTLNRLLTDNTRLEKIVLARQVTFQFSESINKLLLFKLLCGIASNNYHFYHQIGENSVFMGASPERLYYRQGRYVESEAVAGTGKRGDINGADVAFAKALLASEKDQREHSFVRQNVIKTLGALCKDMHIDQEASLMDLNMGRHLRSKFWGILQKNVSDIDILETLHPTSAVGGVPSEEALRIIRNLESFDRGWYAGPIGWIGRDTAEFAVAIRSAIASEKQISLYSGAGIVDGSIPGKEWEEIEQKISDFIKILGLDQRSSKY